MKKPAFRPLGDRVQFERIPHPKPKPGEIIVPKPPSMEARIIAVGPKCEHVKAGMRVLIPLNVSGQVVEGVAGRLCVENQVLAILP